MSALDNIVIPASVTIGSTVIRGFQIRKNVTTEQKNPYEDKIPQITQADKELYRSLLNTPVLCNLTFEGGEYTDNNGLAKKFDTLRFETVLMNVSQAKVIVTTAIQGRDGTVKEYIGMDDYHIAINGIIVGPNGSYPKGIVRQLKNILDCPSEIAVTSNYLQNLDVHNIVISDYELPQQEGGYSYQQFNINAISDAPLYFKINNA